MSNSTFEALKNGHQRPWVVSGPCSAETESQTRETCERLAKSDKVHALRAGIWKPRTRPGSFEGIGREALPWLKKAGEETGLPVMTEVANTEHVKQALDAGMDMLWIGARTTVNPFSVQEIADEIEAHGANIPVLIKNPINADLGLWIGAVERIRKAGVSNIAAIHRGFSQYGASTYRNPPLWQIALDFMRKEPNIPMICDPSHMGGKRDLLAPLSQQSLDLRYSGLIIESHITPDEAWSDAAQQVIPERLHEILNGLVLRDETNEHISTERLRELREDIDAIDDQLISAIVHRMQISERIGRYKLSHNLSPYQPERWQEILDRLIEKAQTNGLNESFIRGYLSAIHQESIDHQFKVMRE